MRGYAWGEDRKQQPQNTRSADEAEGLLVSDSKERAGGMIHQWGRVHLGDSPNFHISFTLELNKISILPSSPAAGEGMKKVRDRKLPSFIFRLCQSAGPLRSWGRGPGNPLIFV